MKFNYCATGWFIVLPCFILLMNSCCQRNNDFTDLKLASTFGTIRMEVPKVYRSSSVYEWLENDEIYAYNRHYFISDKDSGLLEINTPLSIIDSASLLIADSTYPMVDSIKFNSIESKLRTEQFYKGAVNHKIINISNTKAYAVIFKEGFYLECFAQNGLFYVQLSGVKEEKKIFDILNSIRLEDWSWKD